jgi:HAMP domain-containing protein
MTASAISVARTVDAVRPMVRAVAMPEPGNEPMEEAAWWDTFDPRYSIRAQAALILGALCLALTLVFSFVVARALQGRIEQSVGPYFEGMASEIREKIDRGIHERVRELQIAAMLPTFRDETVPKAARRAALNAMNDSAEEYAWIGLADMTGRIELGSHGLRETVLAADETWFRTGSRGAVHVGGLREAPDLEGQIPNADGRLRVIEIAVPVMDANGKVTGVLGANLRWSWVESVQEAVVPESARRLRQGVSIYATSGDLLYDAGVSGWSRPPDYPAIPPQQRFRGFMYEDSEGASYFTGYALTRGHRGLRNPGLLVTVRQPVERTFADVEQLRLNILLAGCVSTGLIMVAGWALASLLVRRLRAIETAANYIRRGDVLALIPRPDGNGELARMCEALHRMVQSFRHRTGETPGGHPSDRTENDPAQR